ncbi:glycoside hydrolase family 6 protein [Streptomyces sp. BI20]|uniref:glycoside hydrolase family 6 protein n=1 Tax=Streptomyces sp. BI20 TaxID=3403460 RepID=UPI003C734EB9
MSRSPQALWLGDQTPDRVAAEARTATEDAERRGALPVLALYNVPGRDCSQYSAGGAGGTADYRGWVEAVARGVEGRRALIVLEPDSLALLPSECADGGGELGRTRTEARYAEIAHAVRVLEAGAGTEVYLDAGNAGWHPVGRIVPRLRTAGVAGAAGFAVNVSNYLTDEANAWYGTLISACLAWSGRPGNDPAACPHQWTPKAEARRWLDTHLTPELRRGMKHFVTDTSRNGRGPWTPPAGRWVDPQSWCNPPGRGLGARPTTATGDPLHDAKLWIKTPGESDGLCLRGTAGPEDPARGIRAPWAGQWFPQQALELADLAVPALDD